MIVVTPRSERVAFEVIYRENVDSVFGFLRRRVGAQAAQDLTAEAFCRAFAAYDRYEDRGLPVRAWLFRIAYNLVVGESRRRRPEAVPFDEASLAVDRRIATEGDPGGDLRYDRSAVARALSALSSLPNRQRSVIELRFLQDLTVAEAAEVLDSNEDAVRALTYRALRALRVAYDHSPSRHDGAIS